jgi:iron complex transport system ATP-binding protein
MLQIQGLTGGYENRKVIHNLSFSVQKGEIFGILGPNGSGKTTLLKMISGIIPAEEGMILLDGTPLSSYTSKQLAQEMAVLPQSNDQMFTYSVKETVSLGRYPYQKGLFRNWTKHDEQIVQLAMEQTGVLRFQHQSIQSLSGGEKQRVYLSQALAQEPTLLLLDEPTNHLDISFQKNLLDRLKKWSAQRQLTVVSIFHDLNLASLYCDRLLLLHKGNAIALNTPNEVLQEEQIEHIYEAAIRKQPHPDLPRPLMTLLPDRTGHELECNGIKASLLSITDERITLKSPVPLKTFSSAVTGAGAGWHTTFINRYVNKHYNETDPKTEMEQYILKHGLTPSDTVGMMTAAQLKDVSYAEIQKDGFSVVIVVTAGVCNAVDVSRSHEHTFEIAPGTINSWIFVNGHLTDEAFIQGMVTATEAKVKALEHENIIDPITKTTATGTSTDSLLIAATQQGSKIHYAGTITPLGKEIGQGIYQCTIKALQNYKSRKSS